MCAHTPAALKQAHEVAGADIVERDIAETGGDPRLWLAAMQQDMYGPEAMMALGTASIERRFRMDHDAFVNVARAAGVGRAGARAPGARVGSRNGLVTGALDA